MDCFLSCIKTSARADQPAYDMPTACDDPSFSCRHGFTKQLINGVCQCALAQRIMEGSLLNSYSPVTRLPVVPIPPIRREPSDFDRVPGHPQLILHNVDEVGSEPATSQQRPPHRPNRRPNRRPNHRPNRRPQGQ